MPRVYPHEREAAYRRDADVSYVVRIGMASFLRQLVSGRAAVIRSYRGIGRPELVAQSAVAGLSESLTQAMVVAWLRGYQRARKEAIPRVGAIAADRVPSYTRAARYLTALMNLPPEVLASIERQASILSAGAAGLLAAKAEREITKALADITAEQLHVREGTKRLRETWSRLGLAETRRYQLETLVRTQTQLSYAAGTAAVLRKPEVQSALWGFKYITVGDDRVRDSHAVLDGIVLPKDDQFWIRNTPPNGWNCRCQVIPLFESRRVVTAPTSATVDGRAVRIGADEDFSFHPGDLLGV